MKNSLILCSGGLDSVTAAYYVKKRLDYDCMIMLFFNYGQRSLIQERIAARRCAKELNGKFKEIRLNELKNISNSLLNRQGEVNNAKKIDLKDTAQESGKWYVPCRNIIFITYALAFAESAYLKNKTVYDIFTGFKCEGRESYPDTSKEFLHEINKLSRISCTFPFSINAPLLEKDKEDIVLLAQELGFEIAKTYSCYIGHKIHCGTCLACRLRRQAFYWANVQDPTVYLKS